MDTPPRGKAAPGPTDINPSPATRRVRAALAATRRRFPDHWRGLVESRTHNHPKATGSVTDIKSPEALDFDLDVVAWEPYEHPAVMEGCTAFWTRGIVGFLGIVPISELPADATITLREAHATGFVDAEVAGDYGAAVDGTCLIVGPEGDTEVVYTFHPGEPVQPSAVPAVGFQGRTLTPAEALAMGFSLAKVRRPTCDGCEVCTTGGCLCDTPEEHADALKQ